MLCIQCMRGYANAPPPPGLGVLHLKHSLLDAKTITLHLGPVVHIERSLTHARTHADDARTRHAHTCAKARAKVAGVSQGALQFQSPSRFGGPPPPPPLLP